MAEGQVKQYSLVRFWRYIFTPLLLILIATVWYIVFNISGTQLGIIALPKYEDTMTLASTNASAVITKII